MKVKQAIKKIVAIAATTGIVGATLAGALAYDLGTYPEPFVQNGLWTPGESAIVVGENAKTEDVLGAIEIAASLQAAAKTVTPVDIGGEVVAPTIDNGVKIERSGNKLNYNDTIYSVKTSIDGDDLDMLADSDFENADYTQKITFGSSTGEFDYYSPGKIDTTEFDGGNYVYFTDDATLYTYELTFDSAFSWDAVTDLETKTLDIQGQTYTITDVTASSTTGDVSKMILLAGETTKFLQQDQPITVGDDTIMVVSVNADGTKCGIQVNDVTKWIDVGETETVGGVEVGVTDAIAVNSEKNDQDYCEINIGANKLTLKDGDQAEVNDVEIKGSTVTLDMNMTAQVWNDITILYAVNDKDFAEDAYGPVLYLAEGTAWTDPVFGNFKILFDGISALTEELTIDVSGDEADFTFLNTDGKDVTVDFIISSTDVIAGDTTGSTEWCFNDCLTDTSTYTDTYLWYVVSAGGGEGELHVLKFDEYDADTAKLKFEDVTYGNEVSTDALSGNALRCNTSTEDATSVGIGTIGNIELCYNVTNYKLGYDADVTQAATTKYGAEVLIVEDSGTYANILLTSPDADSDVQSAAEVFNLTLEIDGTDTDEMEVIAPVTDSTFTANGVNKEYKDTDVKMYVSHKGVMFEHDSKNELYMTITYPKEDVFANVFVAPLGANTVGGGSSGGSVDTESINKIKVGMALLDSDPAATLSKNLIVVGGPCINALAEELEQPAGECWEGYKAGVSKIKAFETNGKVAILVAGYEAKDTLHASYVLRDYDSADYTSKLTGEEVEIVATSASDIKVQAPSS